jgi:flagellar biosynthetic protein FliR
MYEPIEKIAEWLPIFLLVFIRISAMAMMMPIIGYRTVNVRIRIMLAVLLTIIIAPALGADQFNEITSIVSLIVAILRELVIGLMIGFGARLLFEGFAMAGEFIGRQMGMAIMNVLDPTSQQQQPFVTQFWMMIMVIFFLVTNSHYFLIETLFQNFSLIPPGTGHFAAGVGNSFVDGGSLLFTIAVQFAAPALVFLLLVDISIAFVARVMPQMNVFFVTLPLKIGVGIMVLIISLRLFQVMFGYINSEIQNLVITIMQELKA